MAYVTIAENGNWLANGGILVMAVIAALIVLAVNSVLPALIVRSRIDRRMRQRARGRLALTYDDGPGVKLTPALLDLLDKHQASATFYLLGFRAMRHPEVCDQIVDAGHEIGCHTYGHAHAWKSTPWQPVLDLLKGYRAMARWLPTPAVFRPPFGKLTTWTWLATLAKRTPLAWWTCDSGDTWPQRPDPDRIVQQVIDDRGGVVLLHSHDRQDEGHQQYVLELTEKLLCAARTHALDICTVSELMAATPNPR